MKTNTGYGLCTTSDHADNRKIERIDPDLPDTIYLRNKYKSKTGRGHLNMTQKSVMQNCKRIVFVSCFMTTLFLEHGISLQSL